MQGLKTAAIAAGGGFVLSFITALISGASFGTALLRALLCGAGFGGLIFLSLFLVRRFLPELTDVARREDGGDYGGDSGGSLVDITVGSDNPESAANEQSAEPEETLTDLAGGDDGEFTKNDGASDSPPDAGFSDVLPPPDQAPRRDAASAQAAGDSADAAMMAKAIQTMLSRDE